MPTITKPRPRPARSVLKDLDARDTEVAERRLARNKIADEVRDLEAALEPLHEERRRLAVLEPGLFDHQGNPDPSVKPNRVVDIDKSIAAAGNLDDLRAQLEHAESILKRAEQGVRDWTESKYNEIVAAYEPIAEQVRDAVIDADQHLQVALERYLDHATRMESLSAAKHPNLRVMVQTPGYDYVASLVSGRERVEPPLPLPDTSRLPVAEGN